MAEIITVERRRRWSDEDKRRIVRETLARGASVNAVAKRHGLHPSQLFAWRRSLQDGGPVPEDPGHFAAVVVSEPAEGPPRLPGPDVGRVAAVGRIEIVLGRGRRIVVGSDVDAAALRRVLDVLEGR